MYLEENFRNVSYRGGRWREGTCKLARCLWIKEILSWVPEMLLCHHFAPLHKSAYIISVDISSMPIFRFCSMGKSVNLIKVSRDTFVSLIIPTLRNENMTRSQIVLICNIVYIWCRGLGKQEYKHKFSSNKSNIAHIDNDCIVYTYIFQLWSFLVSFLWYETFEW